MYCICRNTLTKRKGDKNKRDNTNSGYQFSLVSISSTNDNVPWITISAAIKIFLEFKNKCL